MPMEIPMSTSVFLHRSYVMSILRTIYQVAHRCIVQLLFISRRHIYICVCVCVWLCVVVVGEAVVIYCSNVGYLLYNSGIYEMVMLPC